MVSYNLGELFESVVDVVPDDEAVVAGPHRRTYRQLDDRVNRLAHVLSDRGVGPGDHVALVIRNSSEYLEAMLASFKLRAAPVNVNTRYTAEELRYLLQDADPTVIVHDPEQTEVLDEALMGSAIRARRLTTGPELDTLLDGAPASRPRVPDRGGDDRYVLYTGGTTGAPKGVIWRHEDLLFAALSGGNPGGEPVGSPEEVATSIGAERGRILPASPFTHGTAHWSALTTLLGGGTVVIDTGVNFDAVRLWDLVQAEAVTSLVIVGDAFARPLATALESHPDRWTMDHLLVIVSGGAILSPTSRRTLLEQLPWAAIVDGYGTSETGGQGSMQVWAGQTAPERPRFHVDGHTVVLDDAGRPAPPGSGLVGRLARRGHLPIGYLGDPDKSAETFPTIAGVRWSIPGDLARVEADGTITLLGRGSSSINRGGEKVFPEEVEMVLNAHPAVLDSVVIGIADERFGEEVGAIVEFEPGRRVDSEELERHCGSRLASYKVPRVFVVGEVRRRPSGKADLAWARDHLETVIGRADDDRGG